MMIVENKLDFQDNCLNFIRMMAAFQVFYIHTTIHLLIAFPSIIGSLLSAFKGVPIFFCLSGYFIWRSLEKEPTAAVYSKNRFFRIYPELWISNIITVVLLIWFLFRELEWKYLIAFFITQSTFLQFWTPDCLRSYGVGTPNGSLWTICVLVQFYFLAWYIYKFLRHKKIVFWIAVLLICVGVNVALLRTSAFLPVIIYKLIQQSIFPYLNIFLLGAFLCQYRDKVVPILVNGFWIILALLMIKIFLIHTDLEGSGYAVIFSTLLSLFVISFGYKFKNIKLKKDFSYGFYLYHLIIINVFVTLNRVGQWYDFFLVAFFAFGAAVLSAAVSKKITARWTAKAAGRIGTREDRGG